MNNDDFVRPLGARWPSLVEPMPVAGDTPLSDPFEYSAARRMQMMRDVEERQAEERVRSIVRREFEAMNSRRSAAVMIDVCNEGGFVVRKGSDHFVCKDAAELGERIIAIMAVVAMEGMDVGGVR